MQQVRGIIILIIIIGKDNAVDGLGCAVVKVMMILNTELVI